jgi:hypothetical protein
MSIFNVNSGSIDELFSKKVLLNDKDVEQTLSTEYGRLYFDTSQDMDSDPGSNNFRISGPSWDLISSATITISKTNIVSAKQTKYKSVLDLISSTGASNYQLKVTSVNDSSVYKVFELVKVDTLLNHYRIWVKDIETGWNNLRLEQVPGDGEEFDLEFIAPVGGIVQRFEFTGSTDFTVPNWANKITMVAIGAGGGGGGGGITHIGHFQEQWSYGGGGGAGGNISVKTINKSDIPVNQTTGELFPLNISIGKPGEGGRAGQHPGMLLAVPGLTSAVLNPLGSGPFFDLFAEQYCSLKYPGTISPFEDLTNQYDNPDVIELLNKLTERNIREGVSGMYGYGYGWMVGGENNNSVKYGRNGDDGGQSSVSILNINNDSIIPLCIADGGQGGRGGKISTGNCPKKSDPVSPTVNERRTMAPGGAARTGKSLGDTIILGGPGGYGTVPPAVYDVSNEWIGINNYGNLADKNTENTASVDNRGYYSGSAPLFPFGIEGTIFSITLWSSPVMPYNGSWEEPGEFGIPGGAGGAGVGRERRYATDPRLNPFYLSDQTKQTGWWDYYFKEGGFWDQQLGYAWRYDWHCWGSSMERYNRLSDREEISKDYIGSTLVTKYKEFPHSFSDINSQGWAFFGGKNDDGCLFYPRYFYANPETQYNLPSFNTKIKEFYGIPIGSYFGGNGGKFKPSIARNTFGNTDVVKKNKYAFTDLIAPTTGSGYGVGGGGGQGIQHMYGTEITSHYAKCWADNGFDVTGCHPKRANDVFKGLSGKEGSKGNSGFVVIICES